uniref:Uncharacterized protein n=1 Tax=Terrapene triunguis TaxID=2587831 RepID=A0A674IY74_9SAUR
MKTRTRETKRTKTAEKKGTDPEVQEDASQGLLPLEGDLLSEERESVATLDLLATEPRAVVLLLHQKRKRRLQSQSLQCKQRKL